ncbi:metalloregulator ArsR/SmtB family transcription factor [Geomonas sp. RF6]|uniref:metalloregulator ArsR/SmtB family transcription factor n=1 Tax=Geomonas sp. RF6 TaxID=2897342 RepID=UPI001E5C1242|nr:metalloregulator ArsR/SmtB family transcription factor [Geomonas sp. RF6]UFS70347.1 metalloregulator ArsR/SmtB family transcription factor [Geomonas sp. RF6]
MKPEQCIAIMKALADQSRLGIINSLLDRSQYVEEIASRHGLAPSTVSFHLRKLEQAGLVTSHKEQYYAMVRANDAVFDTTLREIVSVPPVNRELQDVRMEEYRRKVLTSFFMDGRLEKLPAQHKKRLIVLEQFASRFESGRRYSEQEVTDLILPLFHDYCMIRRLLVEEGLVRREGATYWREKDLPSPAAEALPQALQKGPKSTTQETRRTELKRAYKERAPEMGIYQIRNKVNGKIYVGSSRNLEGTRNSRLFQLRMGKIVFNRELQADVTEYGADSFEFTTVDVLDTGKGAGDVPQRLAALELEWLAKLQPFGERGYNSERGYRRALERLTPNKED